jgi:hypothetical protein
VAGFLGRNFPKDKKRNLKIKPFLQMATMAAFLKSSKLAIRHNFFMDHYLHKIFTCYKLAMWSFIFNLKKWSRGHSLRDIFETSKGINSRLISLLGVCFREIGKGKICELQK